MQFWLLVSNAVMKCLVTSSFFLPLVENLIHCGRVSPITKNQGNIKHTPAMTGVMALIESPGVQLQPSILSTHG